MNYSISGISSFRISSVKVSKTTVSHQQETSKSMLKHTNQSLTSIANECGFFDKSRYGGHFENGTLYLSLVRGTPSTNYNSIPLSPNRHKPLVKEGFFCCSISVIKAFRCLNNRTMRITACFFIISTGCRYTATLRPVRYQRIRHGLICSQTSQFRLRR